ncbi:MAG: hypothetical protein GY838_14670 [bacterium]|nr:hypothetical protein [bacterium]
MSVGTRTTAAETQPSYLADKRGLGEWFSTCDHKKIGLMFLGWTVFALLVGSLSGVFPVAKSLGGRGLEPRFIFEATTYHRLLLLFLFLVPALPSVFGFFLLPMQLGARNMALPALSRFSLRFYVIGLVLILVSMFTGPIATGWTLAAPLSSTDPGSFILVAAGLFCATLSWFLTGINIFVTVHYKRAPGMGFFDMPIMAWSLYLTSYMLIAVGVLFGVVIAYLAASRAGDVGLFALNPGLWTDYFWFLVTPSVFFALLPGMGVVFEVVAGISRRAVVGYRMVVGAMITLLGLSFLTWGVYLAGQGQGQDPTTTLVFSAISLLTAVPVALLTYGLLATMNQGSIAGDGPDTFMVGFLLHGGIVCLMGVFLASPAPGAYLGTTMFVSTQLDYLVWGGAVFALLAGLHYWWPKMVGVEYSREVARIGGIFAIIGLNLALIPRLIMGTQGVAQDMIAFVDGPAGLSELSALGWLIATLGMGVVAGNLYASTWSGRKAEANPWGAGTLEWRTDSPPPEKNFETPPEIEGAYRY